MVNKNRENIKDILNEPLAIIGMNCQFPGMDSDVEDIDSFYKMLLNGQSPVKEVPKNRWNVDEYYDPDRDKADKIIGRKGGFLNNPQLFDASFFKIATVEAKQMDPQHRLFLEVAIRALNHANLTLGSLSNSNTGVFYGTSAQDYSQLNYKDNIEFNAYTQIGAASSAAAGRLSHFLNLKGPSLAVDTACSSSLSALCLAANSLRIGQCSLAIVGGVHLNLCPENFIGLTKANMLSAHDQCSSFDIKADGFVRSEGCGVVIVKRLSDAIKDNNTIFAVVKSVVMNQDGEDGTVLVAPNIKAQIALHQETLAQANVTASDIDYLEAHGTGTIVGDSVEFNAIQHVHQGLHSKEKPLIIGALKSNIGHGIASSGIASLIKVICALWYEKIPPNLHYSKPNQAIDPQKIPAFFPTQEIEFKKFKNKKRYVQVSNFGFSGTNVSAIIEEADNTVRSESIDDDQPKCFVVSANSEYSLKHMITSYVSYLKNTSTCLRDICYTLIDCRDHFKYRCAIIASDKNTLIKKIESQEYELHKVILKKEVREITPDTQNICEIYLAGFNIKIAPNALPYYKVDLPLYHFDRKSYWHESRVKNLTAALQQQSREQQVEIIKNQLAAKIQTLLKRERIDEYEDFGSLGLTQELLAELDQSIYETFSCTISTPAFLTLDKLARHLQQILLPAPVVRQPTVNVLDNEPIAIIGMSCRFPKATNIDEFLSLLERGESGMVDIPLDRWDNEKFYDPDVNALGRLYIKQLGLIEHIRNFDAEFFNISPREAKLMSPQLRVFLETSYHALENANLPLTNIKDSKTGVFVGVGTNEYPRLLAGLGVGLDDLNIYFATGNVLNAIPGRVAYAFDFHGPIQAIDTACSSSMTAIHDACVSLQSGDCDMALAGGVNILLAPDSNITLSKARMLSPESRCKTFSEDADGYARSEGCGVIVLKRLSTALKDKDTILAVIKGTSINSDGKSGGFTVPNGIAQEEVIRSALAKANLSPADVDYIEAHGTGTPLADPIEVNALTKIFSEAHSQENPLYISSVKTNIGHSESASGVAGVIKTVLSLHTHQFFKHLNFKKLNPQIELKNTVIPLSTMDWHKQKGLRCAGVSSFGFSGANAHAVLQEVPLREVEPRTLPQESLLLISAKSKTAIELLLASYQKFLANTDEEFADICYTAATCRNHFLFRVAIKAKTAKEAASLIEHNEYKIYQIKKEKSTPLFLHQSMALEQLQTAYQDGVKIDWFNYYNTLAVGLKSEHTPDKKNEEATFGDNFFIKVKLPLYEFDREEHWFETKDKLKEIAMPKDWCFQLQWQHQPCIKNQRKIQDNHWLLLGAKHLASRFQAQGLSVVSEEDNYPLEKLNGVLFAMGLDFPVANDIESNVTFQKNTLKRLLALIKELNQKSIKLQLIVLTTNAITELAAGKLNLSNSPLIGFCRTLVLELPQFHTVLIDSEKTDDEHYIAQVIDELNYNDDPYYEHIVAYRDKKRFIARLKKNKLVDRRRSLYGEGRYLVTGGCGGLGLVTAQALLSSGAREVILTSRNVNKPAIEEAIKKLKYNYTGRTIRAISLDVTDKEKLQALLVDLNSDGLLKGIIHAAGAAVKAALIEHTDNDIDHLFSAKVLGGWYLHELSQNIDLDFFVVYSSISSVFGSNKESVYSGTNSFLDALIAERQRLGMVGTAIDWGPWGEVGMAKKRSQDQGLKQSLISNEQGHAFIKILINEQLSHAAIISPDYLKFMLDFVPKPLPAFHQFLANILIGVGQVSDQNLSAWLNDYLEVNVENRLQACIDLVTSICKEILEISDAEDLDENEGFFELGFDSLMITELATKLKENLAPTLKVTATIGFDYPSINKLAQYIESELDKHLIKKQAPKPTVEKIDDSIAIIGMSCNFPNAPDIAAFEALLEEGRSGMREIPMERWDNKKYYDPNMDAPGKSYVKKLGLIENIKGFDAVFFGISPREAKLMEPQQRMFLACSYHALEHANYTPESLRGSLTGVFAGVGPNEYYAQLEKSGFSNEELSVYSITGNVSNLIPGRVAYIFDFKGPSISVDTACSSSMVAIHYACQSLKNREVDYALAGGVNVLLMPESNVTLCKAKALSPDGECKTFDEHADGYARAEGCGVLFLKRLTDALRDKDTILAVIKASAVNNDGKSAGLTVPNGISQEEVMKKALSQTDLTNSDISYIETHGTGTPLGDPIEVHAINKVYGNGRGHDNPLYLGAVKTNIGHLESAAGVASIIKAVISLQKKKIYPLLNFKKLNPHIHLGETRLALQKMDWNTHTKLKCVGVNAFGFSGTNAHVILQEFSAASLTSDGLNAVENYSHAMSRDLSAGHSNLALSMDAADKFRDAGREARLKVRIPHLLVFSAKSQNSLDKLTENYQQYLATTTNDFGDICFTAATCREHHTYRVALVAQTANEASQLLETARFNEALHFDDPALKSVFNLYLQGKEVDWVSYYKAAGNGYAKVNLPYYPFDLVEFWVEKKAPQNASLDVIHPLLGQMFSLPGNEYLFCNKLDLDHFPYIQQNYIFDKVVLPVTAYIEAGLAAAKLVLKRNAFCIEKFHIERPLYPKSEQEFQVQVKPQNENQFKINIFAKQEDNWQLFSEMEMGLVAPSIPESVDLNTLKSSFVRHIKSLQIYEYFKSHSFFYDEKLQVLQESYIDNENMLSKLVLPKTADGQNYYYHPLLLDGAMQSIWLFVMNHVPHSTYVPYAFARMITFQEAPRNAWVHLVQRASDNENELCFDIKFYDNSGVQIGEIEKLKLRKVTRAHFISYEPNLQHLYHIRWNTLKFNLSAQTEIPELLVIASDPVYAKKVLVDLNYQFIDNLNEIKNIENKNIVFLYHQDQFNALFHCCQKLFKLRPNSFILVTENAYAIHDKDKVNPYHTMASSFWKSFSNELELSKNYIVDLDAKSNLSTILSILYSTSNSENQFAVRDSIYIPRLKKMQLPTNLTQDEMSFKSDASYLITGGTGGLARLLMEYLMQRGAQHIIITSRSECPNPIKELMNRARKKNIFIHHYQADASNYQQMATIIAEIEQGSYPLQGVFHLAGRVQDGLLINLSDEEMQPVLSAKMDSALILHQLTQEIPLDFFVLFSSSASLLGARGQANYVAANGFLDGLAYLRQQQGLPAIAINWGPFNAIGMTANLSQAIQQRGFTSLEKSSIDILDVLLKSQLAQIAVCPINWEIYFKFLPKQAWLADLVKNNPVDQHFLNALRQHTQEESMALLGQALREIVADVLALDTIEQIKIDDGLFSLGLDSLMAIEIRNRIHDKLQCPTLNLSIEYFINKPTIRKIAKSIVDELQDFFNFNYKTEHPFIETPPQEEVPLCDFQYVFWVLNKRDYPYNIGTQLQIQGKLNKEYVAQAFDFVVKRNSAFWLSFNKEEPIQVLKRQGQFALIYKDVSLENEPKELSQEFQKNMLRAIPLCEQPLIRVYLYKINSDLHELHIVIPHIIVDGPSCDLVLSQFKTCYDLLAQGEGISIDPERDSFLNYVKKNNSLYEKNLKEKIDFWRDYNKAFKMLYLGPQYFMSTASQKKYLFHYPIDSRRAEQFIEWHKTKNMNVSTGLIAVCHIAFYKLSRQKNVPFIQIHSGREGSQYNSIVGLFSEYKKINSALREEYRFIDFIKAIDEQQLKAAPYQKCSHVIKNNEFQGAGLAMAHYLRYKWNKFWLAKQFKKSKLDSKLIDIYLKYLSWAEVIDYSTAIKLKWNKLFKTNIPLQKTERLRVLINITPSFFGKPIQDFDVSPLKYQYANHFSSEDRPTNSHVLWILFSKNQKGEYLFSINGPLTTQAKDLIAAEFNQIIAKLLENDKYTIADL
ncbi:SDR family NAD(P)-dependent oxidoreductase [Legionella longbeachae]|uniref:SDR family NAD(P)-dependent oxidoreductase n=1 Tax=Legionella longbeachae TaxID=450 RepID=UPI000A1C1438|nr:SDR family NAD(P)-dependent oxidoreductase [Legionella longbeachae]ARM34745.1 SDR family NAD(P)-dependent oxidoreductase [Legionella longbeachae]